MKLGNRSYSRYVSPTDLNFLLTSTNSFFLYLILVGPGTIPTPWAPVNAGPPGPLGSADTNGSMVDSKNLDVGDMSDVSKRNSRNIDYKLFIVGLYDKI